VVCFKWLLITDLYTHPYLYNTAMYIVMYCPLFTDAVVRFIMLPEEGIT